MRRSSTFTFTYIHSYSHSITDDVHILNSTFPHLLDGFRLRVSFLQLSILQPVHVSLVSSGTPALNSDPDDTQALPQYVKRVIAVAGNTIEVRKSIPSVIMALVGKQNYEEIGASTQCLLITQGKRGALARHTRKQQ